MKGKHDINDVLSGDAQFPMPFVGWEQLSGNAGWQFRNAPDELICVETCLGILGNFNTFIKGTNSNDGMLDRGIVMELLVYQTAPEVLLKIAP
jgi:hypothetical protein